MEKSNAENIINEIQSLIKALKDCGGWVKRGNGEGWFNHEILADALALINSQEQRIKELTEEYESMAKSVNEASELIRKLRADKKELTEEKEKLGLLIDELEKEKRELWEERNRIYNDLQDWKAIAEQYQKQFEDCAEDRAKLTEENERLREDNEIKSQKRANIFEIANAFERGRTDGVRKMLQRIKEDAVSVSLLSNPPKFMLEIREDALDQIAKEMLEEEE